MDGSADPFAGGGPAPALAVFVPDDSDGSEEGRGVVEGEGAEELQDALTHRLQGTRVGGRWFVSFYSGHFSIPINYNDDSFRLNHLITGLIIKSPATVA